MPASQLSEGRTRRVLRGGGAAGGGEEEEWEEEEEEALSSFVGNAVMVSDHSTCQGTRGPLNDEPWTVHPEGSVTWCTSAYVPMEKDLVHPDMCESVEYICPDATCACVISCACVPRADGRSMCVACRCGPQFLPSELALGTQLWVLFQ